MNDGLGFISFPFSFYFIFLIFLYFILSLILLFFILGLDKRCNIMLYVIITQVTKDDREV